MREATVCHLLRGSGKKRKICLGEKLGKIFMGRLIGPGGGFQNPKCGVKRKKGKKRETIFACAKRETREEWGVTISGRGTRHRATVDYYFKGPSERYRLKQRVHYVDVTEWKGKPRPLEEFGKISWYSLEKLPFDRMVEDYAAWFPLLLNNPDQGVLSVKVFYLNGRIGPIKRIELRFA